MNAKAILIAAALLSSGLTIAPVAVRADVKAGVDAWEAGKYQSAVASWRPLALAGNADAQFNLGQAHKLGRGVPADLAQAEIWFRRAADQGHLQAEDNLGLVMFTAGKREAAMPYITRAAARGEPRAQYVLGTAHYNGDLAARDHAMAYALTKRASDTGLDVASARLAQLDHILSLEERQRGLRLLPDLERSEQRARLTAATTAAPPPRVRVPAPLQPAAVPPSRIEPVERAAHSPAPPKAGVAAATAPAGGNWRAQLGAFSSADRARTLWAALAKAHPSIRAARQHVVPVGTVTRLQAGDFRERTDAEAFCARIRTAKQPCVTILK
jgi:uncharacterized protein